MFIHFGMNTHVNVKDYDVAASSNTTDVVSELMKPISLHITPCSTMAHHSFEGLMLFCDYIPLVTSYLFLHDNRPSTGHAHPDIHAFIFGKPEVSKSLIT